MLLLQGPGGASWVGPTMAVSLVLIALAFLVIAVVLALAARQAAQEMHQLSQGIESLRAELNPALRAVEAVSGEGERLATLVSNETEEIVRASRALREGLRERIVSLEAVYEVLAEEIEETAIEAAVTLRTFRTGASWFGTIRRLLRLGRRR
jgi:flagellar biosynthesis/type III secretory pathway M-ring protein FliF/YscJ